MKHLLLPSLLLFTSYSWADLQRATEAIHQGNGDLAIQELTRLAGEGNAEAQFKLGKLYAEGQLTKADPSRAILALTLSAANGNLMAKGLIEAEKKKINLIQLAVLQEELGTLFQKGGPVKIQPEKAALWLGERALNPVQFNEEERGELARKVGRIYEEKIFRFTSAHSWYLLAEAFGSERAVRDRQRMELFLQEQSIAQSRNEAIKEYKRYLKQRKKMVEGKI